MDQNVAIYINKGQPWQVEICNELRDLLLGTVPGIEEQFEYGKPHYLKAGHYVAAIHVMKDKVILVLFNARDLKDVPKGVRSVGDGDRKAINIIAGQRIDRDLAVSLLQQIASKV